MPIKTVELDEAQEGVLSEIQSALRSVATGNDGRPSRRHPRIARMTAEAKLLGLGISRYTARNIVQGTTPWVHKPALQ